MKMLLGFIATLFLGSSASMADVPATHGMLLFGQETTYASHLPMFHAPHDYQVIMEIQFSNPAESSTVAAYEQAKANGQTLFTLVPEVMDLTKVIDGEKTSFQALVFSGHFERGGDNLGTVEVAVEKLIYAKRLEADQQAENLAPYLVFGSAGEYYAAHVIGGAPSFDAIVSVDQPYNVIEFPCGRGSCPDPIVEPVADSALPMVLPLFVHDSQIPEAGDLLGTPFEGAKAKVLSPIYVEINELAH